MKDCIFCKIKDKEIPAAIIYEDDNVISFLDIMPASKGHCLVVPKKHAENLLDIPEDELSAIMKAIKKIGKAMSLSMGNGAFNVIMNNGKEAGQVVHHAHIHIIPRFKNDGIRIHCWSHVKYKDKEMDEFKEKIKKFL